MIKIFTLIFLSLSLLASYLTYYDIRSEHIDIKEEKSVRTSSHSSGFFRGGGSSSGGGYSYGK